MSGRKLYDDEKHIHFVTFSCYKRRKFLQHERAARIVIGNLGSRLARHNGICLGFVIMSDHVHALIWFPETGQLSPFMNEWKTQSSIALKVLLRTELPNYWATSTMLTRSGSDATTTSISGLGRRSKRNSTTCT